MIAEGYCISRAHEETDCYDTTFKSVKKVYGTVFCKYTENAENCMKNIEVFPMNSLAPLHLAWNIIDRL